MIHGKLPWRSQRTFPNLGQHILCWTDKQAHTLEPSGLWISTYKHTQILTSHLCHTYSQAFQLKSLFKTWFIQATKGWPSNKPLVWDTTWFRKHFYIRLRSASSASHSPRCSGEEDTVFLNCRAEHQQPPCWTLPLLARACTTSTDRLLVFHLHFTPSSVICALIISHYWRPCCNEF